VDRITLVDHDQRGHLELFAHAALRGSLFGCAITSGLYFWSKGRREGRRLAKLSLTITAEAGDYVTHVG
jgi:hypothetical protein